MLVCFKKGVYGPDDMCGLQLESRFAIPWRVKFISDIDGYVNVPLSRILLKSSTVKTDLKYRQKF